MLILIMDLSKNIREIRESLKIKQIEMANALDIDPPNYARLEKRGNKLSFEQLQQIADVFKMSVVDIISYPNVVGNGQDSERVKELEIKVKELERLYIYERMRANRIMVNQAQDDLITAQSENLELETIQDLKDRIAFYKKEVEKDEKDLKNLGLNMFTINVSADSPPTR